jgi:gliding motility-associated transport system permease protein
VMFAGYLALALLALTFVAVGLFTSSVTQNQIIAAISSFGILIMLYVISWPEAGGETIKAILKYLSLPEHFSTMVRGVIDTADIVFFLSAILLPLFLTQRAVESARWH